MARTAVVLMNLGGPDRLEAVRALSCPTCSAIRPSWPARRFPLALGPHHRVAPGPVAREIYRRLGGAHRCSRTPRRRRGRSRQSWDRIIAVLWRCVIGTRPVMETAGEVAIGRATRSFACRSIRNSRRRRQLRHSPPGGTPRRAVWDRLPDALRLLLSRATGIYRSCRRARSGRRSMRLLADDKPPRLLLTAHGLPKRSCRPETPIPTMSNRPPPR